MQDEFVPRDVVHRDPQVRALTRTLEPIIDGYRSDGASLHGKSGTGKTCIARFAVDRLRQNTFDVEAVYVNTWEHYTRFKALYQILDGINKAIDIHRQSTPRDVLLDRLKDRDGPPMVVILDEIDQLEDKDLLYDLHTVKDLTPILIANDHREVFAELDDRVQSRMNGVNEIKFDRYGVDELTSILQDRVHWGLEPGVISDDQLYDIADHAAGDARTAIGILRNAAKQAQQQCTDTITDDLITDAVPETRDGIQQTNLDRLTPHQRVLFGIINDAGRISPSDLYDRYTSEVDNPKSNRTVRNYLKKMERYELVGSDGKTRDRLYKITNS